MTALTTAALGFDESPKAERTTPMVLPDNASLSRQAT